MVITSPRRYYLLKRIATGEAHPELAAVWRAKQEGQSGTALAADFPHQSTLAAVGYTASEDLDGATEEELVTNVGLTSADAKSVLAAFAAL